MKKFVIVLVLVVAGLAGYTYWTTGKLGLWPTTSSSAVDDEVADLQRRLEAARQRLGQAGRSAAVAGIDTTSDVESVRAEVDALMADAKRLESRAGEMTKPEVRRIERQIEAFRKEIE